MSSIHTGRVVLGGVIAGALINLFEWIFGVAFGEQLAQVVASTGLAISGRTLLTFAIIGLASGVLMLWFYAAIRTRFGPGPRTAIVAAVYGWILLRLIPDMALVAAGMEPVGTVMMHLGWMLVGTVVAVLLGAWIYREE
jgi:hypothetical protein